MRIPQVNTCCCGCSLETGSLIIGWLDLIGGILLTVSAISTAINGNVSSEVSVGGLGTAILLIINGIVTAIISVCLIVGVHKRALKLIRSWVILSTITSLIYFFGGTVNVIMVMVQGFIGAALTSFIAILFTFVLYGYMICVVHSLHREFLLSCNRR